MELDYYTDSAGAPPMAGVAESGCFYLGDPEKSPCDISKEGLLRWSYRAIMDLFADLLLGAGNSDGLENSAGLTARLHRPDDDDGLNATFGRYTYTSQVLSTSLADTVELGPFAYYQHLKDFGRDINGTQAINEAYSLDRSTVKPSDRKNLKDAVEELCFNITMSMASSPKFTYNITAPNAPENVTVTIRNMGNIYTYSADKLWLAYGLAIGITVINVALGLLAMIRSGASSTPNFSTIVRMAKNADVSTNTDEQSLPGKDPLPKQWERATFTTRTGAGDEVKSLGSGGYSSVDQIGEEREVPRADEVLHHPRYYRPSDHRTNS